MQLLVSVGAEVMVQLSSNAAFECMALNACICCLLAGRLLFAEALQQGTMNGFFKLIEQYRYGLGKLIDAAI